MPAFVVVTGYLSRSFRFTRPQLRKLVTTAVAPYLVFETLLAGLRVAIGKESMGSPLYVDPHGRSGTSRSSCCGGWRRRCSCACRSRWSSRWVVSLLGDLIDADVLDVSRATGLLPFFVLGLTLSRKHFDRLADARVR